jgi:hypothetical protein
MVLARDGVDIRSWFSVGFGRLFTHTSEYT